MNAPRISEAEWEVMRVVWQETDLPASEIIHRLSSTGWAAPTIKTMLNRLVKKKALGFRKSSNSYLYRSLLSEQECQRQATRSFVSRVFGGSFSPVIAHFLQDEKLTPEEIAELRRLLRRKEKE